MQVAYYARVSTNQQQHEGTIESQRGVLKHHIQQQNWVLLPEHAYSDDGISGVGWIARPWTGCVMRLGVGSSMPSSSCRPIGSPGTMRINGS